jgi:6,7-dimethyl-8-ribityllumazine synthase
MASTLPSRPRQSGPRQAITIVVSTYHEEYARGLIAHAEAEIEMLAPGSTIRVHEVPGSFELPLMVQTVAEQGNTDAIIAFGLLLEGQTAHATLISTAVTEALMRIMLEFRIPVIHEVLVVDTAEQARARCIEKHLNRGTEAARAALGMSHALSYFTRRQPTR